MDHFSNRDASTVPEPADLDPNCTFHFPDPVFVDTQTNAGVSVHALYDTVDALGTQPCAVIGTVENEVSCSPENTWHSGTTQSPEEKELS